MTTAESFFTSERVSFITDDILVQRYVEIDGHLRTVLAVVKMLNTSEKATLTSDTNWGTIQAQAYQNQLRPIATTLFCRHSPLKASHSPVPITHEIPRIS